MAVKKFGPETRKTINWASGTSTEIFIYPSDGSFAERDFLFRISTATVEAEESTFTFFEGITRQLMILKGELDLIHEGRYSKHLKPFDQDKFSGEWKTRSKGRVTDFNLMLKSGATGALIHHHFASNSKKQFEAKTDFYFIYVASGNISVNGETAKTGDLITIERGEHSVVESEVPCDIIEISVTPPEKIN